MAYLSKLFALEGGGHEEVNSTCRHRGFCGNHFFHNRPKNDAQDLTGKNGLERRVPCFCTICDKKSASKRKKLRKLWQF